MNTPIPKLPIRAAVIGCGEQMKDNMFPVLANNPHVQIVAVCDQISERAICLAKGTKEARVYREASEMIRQETLDAIVMAAPPGVHFSCSKLAMTKGIHVFVEKPPCTTLCELTRLVEMAESSDVVTGVGMNYRFAERFRDLSADLNAGHYGRPAHILCEHTASKPCGSLWNIISPLRSFLLAQAIHSLDLINKFAGARLETVTTAVPFDRFPGQISFSLRYQNGVTAALETSSLNQCFEHRFVLTTTKPAIIEISDFRDVTLREAPNGQLASPRVAGGHRGKIVSRPGGLRSGYSLAGYQGELDAFFVAISTKQRFESDFASLRDTYVAIEKACEKESVRDMPEASHSETDPRHDTQNLQLILNDA